MLYDIKKRKEAAVIFMVQNPQLVIFFFAIILFFITVHLYIKFKLNKQLLITEKECQIEVEDKKTGQLDQMYKSINSDDVAKFNKRHSRHEKPITISNFKINKENYFIFEENVLLKVLIEKTVLVQMMGRYFIKPTIEYIPMKRTHPITDDEAGEIQSYLRIAGSPESFINCSN
jgi:hypothetical protein